MNGQGNPEQLGELIALRAAEDGGRVFLQEPDTGGTLRFGELEKAVRELSRALALAGCRKGDRVALLFPNGIQAALAFLGVAASERVAVPLNPGSTARELLFFLENSGARHLLASGKPPPGLAQLPGLSEAKKPADGMALYSYLPQEQGLAAPEGTAMILYTSGTTGRPKGVMLTQHNLLAECAAVRQAHRLAKDDRALCLLPFYHINGLVVTLLTPLFVGLKVVLPPRFSAGLMWSWVQKHKVTWFSAVPAIYSILLGRALPPKEQLAKVRFARSASAALPETVLREFERRAGIPLIESYGISEGGSQITSNPLPPDIRKAGSVGLPFGNEIKGVGADGGEAHSGVTGEVAVRGENVASGYYRNPRATEESFRDGWFFTGDLGFRDAQGYLFLQGRKKEIINRAGEKISPQEIDEILYRYPGVELAAAVGAPDEIYGEEVVAFLRMRGGLKAREEDVKEFCAGQLLECKIPKRVYFIEDFPRGASGKIQRAKLVELYLQTPRPELQGRP
ncbi:MAG: AMP-binding protein [Deltaproteobacteria bacterium]|jgi:acyl-CoA synthetase (AMP-forming)/AMP-acid ligase II|nr:AMP-binding protein [Deltaproteobacteria bacterium]